MELSAHDVVIVTGQDRNTSPALPIPYSDGLVIGSRKNPRVLVVEEDRSDIVKMALQGGLRKTIDDRNDTSCQIPTPAEHLWHRLTYIQCEQTAPSFVIPNLDFVVVTS